MLLFFSSPLSPAFFVIYFLCGISDVLDGFFARKLCAVTTLGARLDSVADVVLTSALLYLFLPLIHPQKYMLICICAVAAIRIISLAIGAVKFRYPAFLHTYANKAAGISLFMFPFIFGYAGETAAIAVVCATTGISAVDEAAIMIFGKELNENVKSIFHINKLTSEKENNHDI